MNSSDESEGRYTQEPHASPDAKTAEAQEIEEQGAHPDTYTKVRPWLWVGLFVLAWLGPLLGVLTDQGLLCLTIFLPVPLGLLADYLARLCGRMAENRNAGPFERRIPLFLLPPVVHFVILTISRLISFCAGFFASEWLPELLPADKGVALLVRILYGSILEFAITVLARFIPARCPNCELPIRLVGGWMIYAKYRCNMCGHEMEYEMRRAEPLG